MHGVVKHFKKRIPFGKPFSYFPESFVECDGVRGRKTVNYNNRFVEYVKIE